MAIRRIIEMHDSKAAYKVITAFHLKGLYYYLGEAYRVTKHERDVVEGINTFYITAV